MYGILEGNIRSLERDVWCLEGHLRCVIGSVIEWHVGFSMHAIRNWCYEGICSLFMQQHVMNCNKWVLLWVFSNIPHINVVPVFFVTLVELCPRSCTLDRGMKSGGVVVVVSSDLRVALGCSTNHVATVVRSSAVGGITMVCCSNNCVGWIGILSTPLPSAISFITFISFSPAITDAVCCVVFVRVITQWMVPMFRCCSTEEILGWLRGRSQKPIVTIR